MVEKASHTKLITWYGCALYPLSTLHHFTTISFSVICVQWDMHGRDYAGWGKNARCGGVHAKDEACTHR